MRRAMGDILRSWSSAGIALMLAVALVVLSQLACPSAADAVVFERGDVSSSEAAITSEDASEVESTVTTIPALLATDPSADGSVVTFSGEAVGDPIAGVEDHTWVNVEDGQLIGVFMTNEQAALIENWGGYHSKGTELRITGVLHTRCPMHGGEFDVHADSVEVISPGGTFDTPSSGTRMKAAGILVITGPVLWLLYVFVKKRRLL